MLQLPRNTNLPMPYRYLGLLVILMFLGGCGVKRPVPMPPPVYPDSPTEVSPPPVSRPSVEPYRYVPGPAHTLYQSAKDSLARGNSEKAEMTLERALRIEPRNGQYWYTMAQIKFQQRQYKQTVQLCLKSKSLAGRDRNLISLNDTLIARARRQLNES